MTNGYDADNHDELMREICARADKKVCKAVLKAARAAPTKEVSEIVALHIASTAVAAAIGLISGYEGIEVDGVDDRLPGKIVDLVFSELGLPVPEGTLQ